jgi:hypothetical protein
MIIKTPLYHSLRNSYRFKGHKSNFAAVTCLRVIVKLTQIVWAVGFIGYNRDFGDFLQYFQGTAGILSLKSRFYDHFQLCTYSSFVNIYQHYVTCVVEQWKITVVIIKTISYIRHGKKIRMLLVQRVEENTGLERRESTLQGFFKVVHPRCVVVYMGN